LGKNEEDQELSVYSWPPGLEDFTTTTTSVKTFLKHGKVGKMTLNVSIFHDSSYEYHAGNDNY